jgi:hypothetical protein
MLPFFHAPMLPCPHAPILHRLPFVSFVAQSSSSCRRAVVVRFEHEHKYEHEGRREGQRFFRNYSGYFWL